MTHSTGEETEGDQHCAELPCDGRSEPACTGPCEWADLRCGVGDGGIGATLNPGGGPSDIDDDVVGGGGDANNPCEGHENEAACVFQDRSEQCIWVSRNGE